MLVWMLVLRPFPGACKTQFRIHCATATEPFRLKDLDEEEPASCATIRAAMFRSSSEYLIAFPI